LRSNFIDQSRLTDEELNKAAIEGIVEYLDDPYTSYLDSEQYANFSDSLFEAGRQDYEGIGASVQQLDDQIVIIGPMPNSPASRAGVMPGDVILEIDGREIAGLTLEEAVNLIRGPKDSTVVLTVRRLGSLVPMEIDVIRDTIPLTNVLARMQQDNIGYISLATFDALTADLLRKGIAELRDEGAEGLILDLRDNGGGLLDSAVAVLSEFVETGAVCLGCNAGGDPDFLSVSGEGTAYHIPLVVLVNGLSASASEIVAGAIQDHGRGTVVGTTTFGKGSVNLLIPLESGAGLYITISRWETPNGRLIEGEGIVPDVVAGRTLDVAANQRIAGLASILCVAFVDERDSLESQEELVEALDGVCNLGSTAEAAPQVDEQLDVAVAELHKLLDR
jgi:carboxyl-terminal processing protease